MKEERAGFLELLQSPERREEAARVQAERREKNSHVTNRTPAQAEFLFGMARVESILPVLDQSDNPEFLLDQLAEGYALQCEFEEAARVTPSEERRQEYLAMAEAIDHLGRDLCGCPSVIIKPSHYDAKGEREEARHPIKQVYDGRRTITLLKCRSCGKVSAR